MKRLVFFFAVLAAVLFSGGTTNAAGQNSVESSKPAPGETITIAPTQLQLVFASPVGGAEAVANMGLSLSCEGNLTGLGTPVLGEDGVTVSAPLTQIPANGTCTVSWELPDGSSGSFSFISAVNAPTTTVPTPDNTTEPTIPGTGEPQALSGPPERLGGPIGLARLASFILMGALVGGLFFLQRRWPEGGEYAVTERYFRIVGILAVVSMYVLVSLMAASEGDLSAGSGFIPTNWSPLFDTAEGAALFARFALTLVVAWFAWVPIRVIDPNTEAIAYAAIFVTAATYGFDRTGGRYATLGIALGILHMAFTLYWVGAIGVMWRVILRGPGDRDLLEALRGWSRHATWVGIGLVVTGAVQAWRIDGWSYINSGHGRVVLFKAFVVAVLLFLDAIIRQFIVYKLKRAKMLNQRAVFRLQRPFALSAALSVSVLALSSWMMSMRPPNILPKDSGPTVQYAIVRDMTGADDFHVRVSIDPGNVGVNQILVELFGPKRIQQFTIDLVPANPAFSGYSITVPITRPGGAFIAPESGLTLRAPGEWTMTVRGTTTTGDLEPLTATFIIADGTTVTTLPASETTTPSAPADTGQPPAPAETTTTTSAPPG
jgi:putative copper export protein/methionine-rich copper-binding protein CopC